MKKASYMLLGSCLLILQVGTVYADQGEWLVRVGAHTVMPKSDNHSVVEVENGTMMTFNATYFFTPNWAIEVLAALPFTHDIDLTSGGNVGETKHLPPTVSAQYHLLPDAAVRPYVGIGVNVTEFFEEDTTGALAGVDLELERSVGLAGQIGVDIDLTENLFLNAEVRYLDIDTRAKLNGASIGTVRIDPWAIGLNLGFRI